MKNNLKTLREKAHMSQEELSSKSGVARTLISCIENEKAESITTKTMIALAGALGVKVTQIFFSE